MNCQNKAVTVAPGTTMTTILQKSSLKTISGNNGSVVVVNSAGNITGMLTGATALPGTATGSTQFLTSGQSIVSLVTAGSGTSAPRMLLPHELGSTTNTTPIVINSFQQSQQIHQYQHHPTSQQQQFIFYNQNGNDVATMYRPIHTSSNTFIHHPHEQHLNNQQQILSTLSTSQQHSNIPKSILGAIQYTHDLTPTTSTYVSGVNNGYTEGSTIVVAAPATSMPPLSVPHLVNTKATKLLSSSSLSTNGDSHLMSLKQNGITTDDNNLNNQPTSAITATTINHTDLNHSSVSNAITTSANSFSRSTTIADCMKSNTVNTCNGDENDVPPMVDEVVEEEVVTSDTAVNLETDGNQEAIEAEATEQEPEPEIDIVINNVVCSFSVRCHLNLREIALNGRNVEFRRENGMVTMKLRRPYTTASIWSSGRITCTGATSEDMAKVGARRYARCLQSLGFPVRFNNFRVVNVLGTCSMPWAIKIVNFSEKYKKDASYEPELHPGVTYKLKIPKATLKIFSTGSITVTAGSVAHVQAAIEHIFPLVYEFRTKRMVVAPRVTQSVSNEVDGATDDNGAVVAGKRKRPAAKANKESAKRKYPFGLAANDPTEDAMYVSDVGEDDDAEELVGEDVDDDIDEDED